MEGVVAGTRHAALLIPQADGRARRVPVQADRMGVDPRLEPVVTRRRQGGSQDLVARPTHGELPGQGILDEIAEPQRLDQAIRWSRLPGHQHVGMLLLVCVKSERLDAEIDVHEITRLDDHVPGTLREVGVGGVRLRPLDGDRGMEPAQPAGIVHGLAVPPLEFRRRRDAGCDPFGRQTATKDAMGDPADLVVHLHLGRDPRLEPADGGRLGRDHSLSEWRGERLEQPLAFGGGQAVGEGEVPRPRDADGVGI